MDADSWQKEQISVAFVHALATRAGCTVAKWNVDKDGVDVSIKRNAPQVDLQLKCTQSPRIVQDGIAFDLDVATYDKLRAEDRSAPGYLVVMVVPPSIEDWIVHSPEQLLLRCSAFYARIQDLPPVDTTQTTAIHLPATQSFDNAAIERMLQHSRERILGPRAAAVTS